MRLEIFDFAKPNLRLRWSSDSETEELRSWVCSAGEKTDTAGRRAADRATLSSFASQMPPPLAQGRLRSAAISGLAQGRLRVRRRRASHRGGFGVRQYRDLHRGSFGRGGVGPHIGEAWGAAVSGLTQGRLRARRGRTAHRDGLKQENKGNLHAILLLHRRAAGGF